MVAPLARPSSPSVRLTPLDHAATRKFAQIAKRMKPTMVPAKARSSQGMSRTKEMAVPAGVLPLRSEEHTSELQSRGHIVCRLLLEKKNVRKKKKVASTTY